MRLGRVNIIFYFSYFIFFVAISLLPGILAMKIHVSMETKILLDSVGGYFLEPRGLLVVEVKVIFYFLTFKLQIKCPDIKPDFPHPQHILFRAESKERRFG